MSETASLGELTGQFRGLVSPSVRKKDLYAPPTINRTLQVRDRFVPRGCLDASRPQVT